MTNDIHSDATRLPEDAAHRLLARAVEPDASRGSEITIAQLREAAAEAGISVAAFDAALAELQLTGARTNYSRGATGRGLMDRFRAWTRGDALAAGADALKESVVRNLLAVAAFWAILMLLVTLDRAIDVQWLVRKATDPLALALGAVMAARLRARPIGVLLAGLAISQGAEFLMDAATGAPAVNGFGAHIALMIAGVAGVLLGGRLLQRPPNEGAAVQAAPVADVSSADHAPPPATNRRALTLLVRPA